MLLEFLIICLCSPWAANPFLICLDLWFLAGEAEKEIEGNRDNVCKRPKDKERKYVNTKEHHQFNIIWTRDV